MRLGCPSTSQGDLNNGKKAAGSQSFFTSHATFNVPGKCSSDTREQPLKYPIIRHVWKILLIREWAIGLLLAFKSFVDTWGVEENYVKWLAYNNEVKYPEFCMGYIDETWYVGCDGHKILPMWSVVTKWAYLIPDLHIFLNWLMTKNQIRNNWYAHVKSDLRSLPTYAHQRRPTLLYLWIWRARKPRTAKF